MYSKQYGANHQSYYYRVYTDANIVPYPRADPEYRRSSYCPRIQGLDCGRRGRIGRRMCLGSAVGLVDHET